MAATKHATEQARKGSSGMCVGSVWVAWLFQLHVVNILVQVGPFIYWAQTDLSSPRLFTNGCGFVLDLAPH